MADDNKDIFETRFTQTGAKDVIKSFNDLARASENATGKADDLNKKVGDLARSANPAQRAYDRLTGGVNLLERAQRKGIITAAEASKIQGDLTRQVEGQLRPISQIISATRAQTAALSANKAESAAQIRTLETVNKLRRQGISVGTAEYNSILEANRALASRRQLLRQEADDRAKSVREAARATAEQATLQRQRDRAFTEQAGRAGYQSGIVSGGRNAASAERSIARLAASGNALSGEDAKALRDRAKLLDEQADKYRKVNGLIGEQGLLVKGLAAAWVSVGFTKLLDEVTTIDNRLKLVTTSSKNLDAVFGQVAATALKTRLSLTDTADLYFKLAQATQELGFSQQKVIDLTRATGQAIQISGSSVQASNAALVQFGQALASNRLGGDELRSITEQAPRLARAIVDGVNEISKNNTDLQKKFQKELKTTELSMGNIREAGKKGLLDTKLVAEALLSQQEKLNAEMAKTTPTIAQSMEMVKTAALVQIRDFNKASGAAQILASSIGFVAENLGLILNIAVPVAAGIGAVFAFRAAATFAQTLVTVVATMYQMATATAVADAAAKRLAVSIGLIALPVAALTALIAFKDEIKLANDATIVFAEDGMVKAAQSSITFGDVAGGIIDILMGKTDSLTQHQIDKAEEAKTAQISKGNESAEARMKAEQAAADFAIAKFGETGSVYATMQEGMVKSTIDFLAVMIGGASLITDAFSLVVNTVYAAVAGSILEIQNLINIAQNGIASLTGGQQKKTLPVGYGLGSMIVALNESKPKFDGLSAQNQTGYKEVLARTFTGKANQRRVGSLNGGGPPSLQSPSGGGDDDKKNKAAKKAAEEAQKAYASLRDTMLPLVKVEEEHKKNLATLANAEKRGIGTAEERNRVRQAELRWYKEASDPIGTYIKNMDEEHAVMGLASDERERALAILNKEREYRKALGVEVLSQADKLRVASQVDREINDKREAALRDSVEAANRERSREASMIGKSASLRQAEAAAYAVVGDALDKNVKGAKEAFDIQVKLNLEQQKVKLIDSLYQEFTETLDTYSQKVAALQEIQKRNPELHDRTERAIRKETAALLETETSGAAGYARAMLAIKAKTEDTAASVQSIFENLYSGLEDQFANLFTEGEFDLYSVSKQLTGDLARATFRQFADPLLSKLTGGLIGGTKRDGSSANAALFVQIANGDASIGGLISQGLGGGGGLLDGIKGLFGGKSGGGGLLSGLGNIFNSGGGIGGLGSILGGLGGGFGGILGGLFGFDQGGSFKVGGQGGRDSQIVAFKASPTETVSVTTPHQQQQSGPTEIVAGDTNITNVLDPSMVTDVLSSSKGSRSVLNVIESNRAQIRRVLGV